MEWHIADRPASVPSAVRGRMPFLLFGFVCVTFQFGRYVAIERRTAVDLTRVLANGFQPLFERLCPRVSLSDLQVACRRRLKWMLIGRSVCFGSRFSLAPDNLWVSVVPFRIFSLLA